MRAELVVTGAAQVLTLEDGLGIVERGAVALAGGRVLDVGPEAEVLERVELDDGTERVDARGGVVLPGLVDPHTHILFAGSRHAEFAARLEGADYLAILEKGGGILSTVDATRAAGDDEILGLARGRLRRLLAHGVTTVEVKSGYGLDVEHELRLLGVARRLAEEGPQRIVPTLLGAHVVPREHREKAGPRGSKDDPRGRDRYVAAVVEEMIPRAARAGLARACDVFLEAGAFSLDETRAILLAARAAGLETKLHAGQFHDLGGAELAAEIGALSVDHAEHVSDEGLAAMARAGVTAVLIPGPALAVPGPWADGRRIRDAGVEVALATDCNPGTSHTESLTLMALLAANRMGLTVEEAVTAMTRGAARALGRDDVGRLGVGAQGDLVVFDVPDWRALVYHFGVPLARTVVVGGRIVLG